MEEVHSNEHHEWEQAENRAGDTPLRGANPHLSRDAHALANHARRLVQNLSEITAGFLLDKNRRDQELQVGDRRARPEVEHGVAKWQPETLLDGCAPKFGSQRIGGFLGDSLDG